MGTSILDRVTFAEEVYSRAEGLWLTRWRPWYGDLGPLIGQASSKPLSKRVGLLAVVIAIAVAQLQPPGAVWDVFPRTNPNGDPNGVVLTQVEPEARHVVPLQIVGRSLRVGKSRVALFASNAGAAALRALAEEAGAFFGAATRPVNA